MKFLNNFKSIASHVFFWMATSYVFTNYSFLRPGCHISLYIEILCVAMIVAIVYFNKFLLFPKLYLKGEYSVYWSINIFLLLGIGFIELQLIKSAIIQLHESYLTPKELSNYLVYVFILVSLRYAAFFAFFYIISINKYTKHLFIQQQKLIAVENKQIVISSTAGKEILVPIKSITYITVEGKYSIVHLVNEQEYKQIKPLRDFDNILPEHLFLHINRNTIVLYDYVCEYDATHVEIIVNNNGNTKKFSFYKHNKEKIVNELKKYVTDDTLHRNCEIKRNRSGKKSNNNNALLRNKRNEICEINENVAQVLETIRTKPNIFASEIKSKLPHISERTIDNYLKQLKNLGLIEYKGSLKKGGYFLI
ncbi:MAG: LytTR family transcriptional regulator [Firmicutes bacterium]|nr:LytTR family transcriptional regulator [Bacillota bacterium]